MLKKLICLLVLSTVTLGFTGCWQVVHVTDRQGNPIEGVQITTSFQTNYIGPPGPSGTTNKRGDAYLPLPSEPYPLYMNYFKRGYRRSGHGYSTNLKVHKTLNPIAGSN